MSKLKVAMIGIRGIPGTSGGAEVVTEEISTRLVKFGADVTVYCRPHYTEGEPAEFKGVKLKYVKSWNTKHFEAISHTFICAIKAAFSDVDVVHFHSIGPSLMSWIPRLTGKKVISTCHGLDWQRDKWGAAAKLMLKLGERASAIFPNKTTGVSSMIKEYYAETYNRHCVYIPNGVTLPTKTDEVSFLEKNGLKKGKYILFLSRLVPEKGLQYLIPAFRKLDTDFKLAIVGAPTHTEGFYEDILKLADGADNIVFTGAAYGTDKDQMFSNAYAFVLPSDIEGMPIVLLESLAYDCASLVSDIPVNKYVVENEHGTFGYHFKQSNIDDLAEKMQYLLDNPKELETLRTKLRDYVVSEYDWDNVSKKYLKLFEALK